MQTGRMSAHEQHVVLEAIARCGLPSRLPSAASVERLMTAMQYDKKSAGGRMRLVLPRGIGSAKFVDDVPPQLVRETWLDLGAGA
jgi:3-dehydroquinate synthase